MKNTPVKLMSVLLLGTALTACSVLSNIAGGNNVKFSSYKNEVGTEEFAAGMNDSIKNNSALNGSEAIDDFAFSVKASASVDQKITNSKLAKKDRGSVSGDASASAKLAFDLNSGNAEFTGKLSASAKMVAPTTGTQKLSSETEVDVVMQQEDEENVKLINQKEKVYSIEDTEQTVSQAMTELKSYLGMGVYYLSTAFASLDPATLEAEGTSIKLYKDAEVYTIVANMSTSQELKTSTYNEETGDYVDTPYAKIDADVDIKLQLDLKDDLKLRLKAEAKYTADYLVDGVSGVTQDLLPVSLPIEHLAGDKETATLKVGLSADYSSKNQTVKSVDTSKYGEVEQIFDL